jgi:hypothetical protein
VRRTVFFLVACLVALVWARPAMAIDPARTSITCDHMGVDTARLYRTMLGRPGDPAGLGYWVARQRDGLPLTGVAYWMSHSPEFRSRYAHLDDRAFVNALYQNVLGRPADPAGAAYWLSKLPTEGRHGVATWMTLSPELGSRRPIGFSAICDDVWSRGLIEVQPGLAVARWGSTVIVMADRSMVDYGAVDGTRTYASRIPGDVVVNANWFTDRGTQAPLVADGVWSGGPDLIERGQIVAYRPGCGDHGVGELKHVWMGHLYQPGPCVQTAVSGVSLVHHGVRADRYPGIEFTGYTATSTSHSFIGFNDRELIVVATREMTASKLADFTIALGATEGVMLDGGGSTQIVAPTASLTSSRRVPSFAVLDARIRFDG